MDSYKCKVTKLCCPSTQLKRNASKGRIDDNYRGKQKLRLINDHYCCRGQKDEHGKTSFTFWKANVSSDFGAVFEGLWYNNEIYHLYNPPKYSKEYSYKATKKKQAAWKGE